MGFCQLAFSLHVQTNGGFIGLLCLGELLGYLIFKHYYDSLASSPASLPLLHEPEFMQQSSYATEKNQKIPVIII